MRRILVALTLLTSSCAGARSAVPCALGAPASVSSSNITSTRPANPSDVSSIDAILDALYGAVSGPPGARDWDRVRSIFAPGAWVAPVEHRGEESVLHIMTLEAFVDRASRNTSREGFFEKEVARRTEAFGSLVHIFSTYEARHHPNDATPFRRGINSIQLFKDETRYWVVSVYWDTERTGTQIPKPYLPSP